MNAGTLMTIQRFAIQDGPGLRTTVFFKGCNLRCDWCHNPESWSPLPRLGFSKARCMGCGRCAAACPLGCHHIGQGEHGIDRDRCTLCGRCIDACPTLALNRCGETWTVEAVMAELQKDEVFYQESGGGVTFSGGECMLQLPFLEALLAACRARGWHAAVDTAGNVPWDHFERILPHCSLILLDLKCVDDARHRAWTDASNQRILYNAGRLLACCPERVWLRVPMIPSFNTDAQSLARLAAFIREHPRPARVDCLPYHALGEAKREQYGLAAARHRIVPPDPREMNRLRAALESRPQQSV